MQFGSLNFVVWERVNLSATGRHLGNSYRLCSRALPSALAGTRVQNERDWKRSWRLRCSRHHCFQVHVIWEKIVYSRAPTRYFLDLFRNKPVFLLVARKSPLKALWEKENPPWRAISLSPSVFSAFLENFPQISSNLRLICKPWVWKSLKLVEKEIF